MVTVVTTLTAVMHVAMTDVTIAAMTANLAKDVEAEEDPLEGAVDDAAPPHGSM
jgi:hypothetical protein